jgi:hypothetical protein
MTALAIQLGTGVYSSAPMTGPDDPGHFISGLMVRDYLASGLGHSPVAFARDYYAHYPKVAIGNWPPTYYAIQGLWMLLLPAAPESVFLLLALMAAATAAIVYRLLRPTLGVSFAVAGGLVFLLLRPVAKYTGFVMAEIPLTLFCTLAVWRWSAFVESSRARDVWLFAACAALTILTKPNGLLLGLVPPLALLITGRWRLLRVPALWWAVTAASLVVAAWVWRNLDTLRAGWASPNRLFGDARGIVYYPSQLVGATGLLLATVAAVGLAARLRRRALRAPVGTLWASAAAAVGAVVLLHAASPAGLDARHLIPAYPFVAMFVAAGAHALAGWVRRAAPWSGVANGAALAGVGLALAVRLPGPVVRVDGFEDVAAFVTRTAGAASPVVALVSSQARGEGAFVSAMAVRDPARPRHTVWRATKLLASVTWAGRHYALRAESDSGVVALLERAGVAWLVLDRSAAAFPHADLLERTIRAHPDRFVLRRETSGGGARAGGHIAVYQFLPPPGRRPLPPTLRQVPGTAGIAEVRVGASPQPGPGPR